ncbi:MAG TPA: multidrug ABC transporter permease [Marinilabiliales bacterium]|nr:MAG: multidrug ABC transporter permease [Bacteroidetes bacterium GWA2_40_14]OFX75120.1 MAG: multidrug ABC transporter permease [Bacteroidetes bacterium GWD2_40_43]OFX93831.1 MAG: multidrug ABC transporter permease [Bacteroidetes bacterium GWE2_40_63]OFY18096.1 MAG: multidrug ABC transporter permease [Bacteroidetes bacterium GWF2_40_13]OFZ27293.1 MAG: multidrug ABC transporter permease [Bacteroidetes bacterium RIFOXYC2_FULL_40_12]HAM99007.1 multidrug ABC transporter permease [Marinilabiliale
MKRFLSFVKKEFHHIFRDVRSLIIIFGIPVAEILIFGFAINTDLKDARIAILDKSKDVTTQQITNKLLSSGYFKIDQYLDNDQQIDGVFKKGTIRGVIVFEPGFGQKFEKEGSAHMQLIFDASEPNTANMLNGYTQGIINNFVMMENQASSKNLTIVPTVRMFYNPNLKSVFMFVPGTMAIILILISALMTSITITREKELGTMEILLGSPLKPIQIILGKVTPYLILSLGNVATILTLAYFVFGLPVEGSLILLVAECTLFIFLSLSLGILISTLSKTMQQAMLISMVGLMMPSMLLSGFIFPVENMPKVLYYFSFIMPPRWFIEILKSIMIKGSGFALIWKETVIMVGMTVLFITISIKKFKIRLE